MAILELGAAPHGGRVRLLPESATQVPIAPRMLIYHSIVGSARSAYGLFSAGSGLESHFIITLDGEIWQLVDTEVRADANYHANSFAVSVETEDAGDPDTQPWTPAQLDALAWIAWELNRIHGIPLRPADRWDGSGIGYHSQFPPWSPAVKTCPGRARIDQLNRELLPRITAGPEDDDMPSEQFFEFWFSRLEQVHKGQTGAIYNASNKHHGEAMEVRWREVNLTGVQGELLGRIHDVLDQQRQMMEAQGQLLQRMTDLAVHLAGADAGAATQVLDRQ